MSNVIDSINTNATKDNVENINDFEDIIGNKCSIDILSNNNDVNSVTEKIADKLNNYVDDDENIAFIIAIINETSIKAYFTCFTQDERKQNSMKKAILRAYDTVRIILHPNDIANVPNIIVKDMFDNIIYTSHN